MLQPICYLLDRPKCFRLGRTSPVGICTRGFNVPFQGTHNNEGENAVRGLALGRKNWLFCGSDRGGRAAAIHFSLLTSCKRHDLDPWVYYRDILIRLPAMLPGASEQDLLALLPHRWRPT